MNQQPSQPTNHGSSLDPVDILRRHEESLLIEATICGWDILDCFVVVFSLLPPRINIMNLNDKNTKKLIEEMLSEITEELSIGSYLDKVFGDAFISIVRSLHSYALRYQSQVERIGSGEFHCPQSEEEGPSHGLGELRGVHPLV